MRWSVIWLWTFPWVAADSLAEDYPTPGFDCANATAPQELRICRSPQLGELDGRHWHLAERAIKGARDPEAMRSGVESWINQVRNVCETDKCLVDAYTARNAQLESDIAAPAQVRPQPMPRGMPAIEAPPALAPAPSPAAVAKPPVKPPPAAEPEDNTSPWPWILAAALVAALGGRWLSARADRTGRARPDDRE